MSWLHCRVHNKLKVICVSWAKWYMCESCVGEHVLKFKLCSNCKWRRRSFSLLLLRCCAPTLFEFHSSQEDRVHIQGRVKLFSQGLIPVSLRSESAIVQHLFVQPSCSPSQRFIRLELRGVQVFHFRPLSERREVVLT